MKHICLLLLLVSLSANAQRVINDNRLVIGTATDVDVSFEIDRLGATNPALMWDASTEDWTLSHDGTTFYKWSGDAEAATLTSKTFDADLNSITNIENSDIKSGAAIDASKIHNGTVSNTEFAYINTLSSNAQTQLASGVTATALVQTNLTNHEADTSAHGVSSTVVGISETQTLTNKTISADSNTITNIENADIKSAAAIDASKIADGTVSSTEYQYINSLSSNAQTQISSKQGTLTNSAGLAAALSDETGTGNAVFSADPVLTGNVTVPDQTASAGTDYAVNAQYVDAAIASVVAGGVNDASAGVKGILQLTGDLGGTATSPTVPGLALKADQTSISNVDNTSDASKPVSTATQTALDLKANLSSASFTGAVSVAGLLSTSGGWNIESSNNVIAGDSFGAGNSGKLYFGARSMVTSPSDGILRLTNSAQSNFTRLQLGGTTSSFPSLKRSATGVDFRLADDSDFSPIQGTYKRFGSGTPEGSVTAPIGATYSRTDGSSSTSLYVKESGTGSSGWASVVSDTYNSDLPAMRPTLLLDFANTKTLDPKITFTRTTTKTCIDAFGKIVTLAINQPCFDHNPTTLESLGLLIEEARTNLALRSQELDNASWTKTRTTVTADSSLDPATLTTLDKVVEDTSVSTSHTISQTVTSPTTSAHTVSVFGRAAERNIFIVMLNPAASSNSVAGGCNFSTGATFSLQNNGNGTGAAISMVAYPNGLYRCILSGTPDTSGSQVTADIRLHNGSTTSYTGDGTSGVHLGHINIELGAFPTSYIATTSVTVTRAVDAASMTGTNFSSWFNALEGTFYFKGIVPQITSTSYLFTASDGTANNFIGFSKATTTPRFDVYVSGAVQAASSNGAAVVGTSFKVSSGYKLNDFAYSKDGLTVATDVSGTIPIVDRIYLSGGPSGTAYSTHISSLLYYPKKLTNAELQAVSR